MRNEGLTFRPDIEGLRAIAVVLVVLSHVGIGAFAGGYIGVDVFFVISGFLITSLLLKEIKSSGTLSISRFYARRMTRLLPASTVVVVATVIGAWLWLPPIRFREYSYDALASTFYAVNVRLAATGTDYLTAAATPSPLQHFWSLAVEEQFYLVWPLLLLGASLTWWRGRSASIAMIGASLAVLGVVSFVLSVTETQRSAPWAYFGAHTRAWELALGAFVAVFALQLGRIPKAVAAVMAWVGLAGVIASALVFDESTAFPGYVAVLPVAATGLILAGGVARPAGGAGLLLGTAPFQFVGRLSYGLYLWHWPVLLIVPVALGVTAGTGLKLLLAVFALLLAAASYYLLENPIRRARGLKARPARGIGLGVGLSLSSAGCVLVLVAVGASLIPPNPATGYVAESTRLSLANVRNKPAELQRLIAAALTTSTVPVNLTPALDQAGNDKPVVYTDKCHLDFPDTSAGKKLCAYGDPNGIPVVLFGDSHAAHWFPALESIASERNWRLFVMTKSSCPAATVYTVNTALKRPYDECMQWRDNAVERIKQIKPKLVVMSSNGGDTSGPMVDQSLDTEKVWVDAWVGIIDKVRSPTTKVALISDTPWPRADVPECVSAHPEELSACNRPQAEAVQRPVRRAAVASAATAAGATVIDPVAWLCADGICPVIVGDTLVYFDASHLSVTYAKLLAPLLAEKL